MKGKERFDELIKINANNTLCNGWVVVAENEDGELEYIFNELNLTVFFGNPSDEEICKELKEGEVFNQLKEPGVYDFQAWLTFTPAQIGDYPPPNIECKEYWCVEYIEFFKHD